MSLLNFLCLFDTMISRNFILNARWLLQLLHVGSGFASEIIDLDGLQVSQISTFNKVWSTYGGGLVDQGFTMFEPSRIPQGFFMLGCYSQPNNKPLSGWVLVGKDACANTRNPILKKPLDFILVWNSARTRIS